MAKATPPASDQDSGTKPARSGSTRDAAAKPTAGGKSAVGGKPPAGGKPAAGAGKPPSGGRAPRPQAPAGGGGGGDGGYFRGVVSELRKVTWPTMPELTRMTQVVIATVIIFAALIGGLDFLLGLVAKPLYTQQGTAAPTGSPLPIPTLIPQTPSAGGTSASPGAAVSTSSGATTTAPAASGTGTTTSSGASASTTTAG